MDRKTQEREGYSPRLFHAPVPRVGLISPSNPIAAPNEDFTTDSKQNLWGLPRHNTWRHVDKCNQPPSSLR